MLMSATTIDYNERMDLCRRAALGALQIHVKGTHLRVGIHDEEDIAQEVILRQLVAEASGTLRNPESAVWQIARNLVIDLLRKEELRQGAPIDGAEPAAEEEADSLETDDVRRFL